MPAHPVPARRPRLSPAGALALLAALPLAPLVPGPAAAQCACVCVRGRSTPACATPSLVEPICREICPEIITQSITTAPLTSGGTGGIGGPAGGTIGGAAGLPSGALPPGADAATLRSLLGGR